MEHSGEKSQSGGACELTFGFVEFMCLWDTQGASPALVLPRGINLLKSSWLVCTFSPTGTGPPRGRDSFVLHFLCLTQGLESRQGAASSAEEMVVYYIRDWPTGCMQERGEGREGEAKG